jgi:hypothetical protein
VQQQDRDSQWSIEEQRRSGEDMLRRRLVSCHYKYPQVCVSKTLPPDAVLGREAAIDNYFDLVGSALLHWYYGTVSLCQTTASTAHIRKTSAGSPR